MKIARHMMIGASKRNAHGGFIKRHKRKIPSPNEIKTAANLFLAARQARGKEVCP